MKFVLKALFYSAIGVAFVIANTSCSPNEQSLRDRVVKLVSPQGSCSGEQVMAPSGVNYILTAGHCSILEDENHQIEVIKENGESIKRKVLAEDPKSDLLLLEGLPGVMGIQVAESVQRHIRTFTHGHGLDTYKTEGELIQNQHVEIGLFIIMSQEDADRCPKDPKYSLSKVPTIFGDIDICALSVTETVSTAFTVPGSSGGMVVDDSGSLQGVVSAGGDGFAYFVTLTDIREFLAGY